MSKAFVTGFHPICERLANALGFSGVTSMKVELAGVKDPLTVTITKFVTEDEAGRFVEVLSRYNIEATPIEANPE